jgi:hypothetical protein
MIISSRSKAMKFDCPAATSRKLGPHAGQKVLSLQTSRPADFTQPGCVNAHGF